jgi:16S rRNA (guanine1207-N2)-methyltransferase
MSDVNKRAVKLAKMNLRLNKVDCKVFQSDMYSKVDSKFDTIIINPPQKAGKEICFSMITLAKDYLKPKGLLQIVARHQKGGKVLMGKMEEVFGNVSTVSRKSGYRVYLSEN